MKKKLNTDAISNELEGASLFFAKPQSPATMPENTQTEDTPVSEIEAFVKEPLLPVSSTPQAGAKENLDQKRSFERTTERTNVRTEIKPKREKIRHTFDIYQDQLIALQVLQLKAVQSGKKKPKLGKMVSEGIDLYLKQKASKKK